MLTKLSEYTVIKTFKPEEIEFDNPPYTGKEVSDLFSRLLGEGTKEFVELDNGALAFTDGNEVALLVSPRLWKHAN